jgi:hypothetical protein
MEGVSLNVNGKVHQIDVPSDTPVLRVLRDVLGMTGTKFGCGMAHPSGPIRRSSYSLLAGDRRAVSSRKS